MKETIAKINEVMAVLQAELAKAAEGNKAAAARARKRVPQTVYRRAQVVRQDTNTTAPARPLSCGNLFFI